MSSRYALALATAGLCAFSAACQKHVVAKAPAPAPQNTVASAPPPSTTPMRAETPRDNSMPRQTSSTPDVATRARIQELLDRIQDAYFDYNQHSLRSDAEGSLKVDAQTLAEILQQYPTYKLTVEGYCDERGSDEYNLALGEARANQAKEYLVALGVPAAQLRTVSYGKEKPVCGEHDENCWQKNRRAHITQDQPVTSGG